MPSWQLFAVRRFLLANQGCNVRHQETTGGFLLKCASEPFGMEAGAPMGLRGFDSNSCKS